MEEKGADKKLTIKYIKIKSRVY